MFKLDVPEIINIEGETNSYKTLGQAEKAARRLSIQVVSILNEKNEVIETLESYTDFPVRVKGSLIWPRQVTFKAERK